MEEQFDRYTYTKSEEDGGDERLFISLNDVKNAMNENDTAPWIDKLFRQLLGIQKCSIITL